MVPGSKKSKTRFFVQNNIKIILFWLNKKWNQFSFGFGTCNIYSKLCFFCLNEILSDFFDIFSILFNLRLQSDHLIGWKLRHPIGQGFDCVFVTFVTLLSNYNYYVIDRLRNGDLFTRGMIHYVWLIMMTHSVSFITWIGVFTVTMVQVPKFLLIFDLKIFLETIQKTHF